MDRTAEEWEREGGPAGARERQLLEYARSSRGVAIRSYKQMPVIPCGAVIREERCEVEVRYYVIDRQWHSMRVEDGAVWGRAIGSTIAKAYERLGPEPERNTVGQTLGWMKEHSGNRIPGPKPPCPECGSSLHPFNAGHALVRSYGLICICCEYAALRHDLTPRDVFIEENRRKMERDRAAFRVRR